MPPLDFSTSKPEENEEFISPEDLFAPSDSDSDREGKQGGGGLEERLEEKVRKRGEREIDKFFEEKWGGPKGVGRGAAGRAGTGAAREAGEEAGGQIARGAAGVGGRAAGGAAGKAAVSGTVRAGTGAVVRGVAAGATEGATAGSVVPGAGTAIGAVVTTVLSLPKSFAGMSKGEYSQLSFVEITVVGVACAFIDLFFIFSIIFSFIPLVGPALSISAIIFGPAMKLVSFFLIAFWITKYKGSVKPWGMLRLIWKIVTGTSFIPTPVLTFTFLIESYLHNKEGQDTLLKESKPTKEKGKQSTKTGGGPRGAAGGGRK